MCGDIPLDSDNTGKQLYVVSLCLQTLIEYVFPVLLGKKKSAYRLKTTKRTDERIRLMNEIITGISVIKMYAWEKPFEKLISEVRR